jgi:uncharacterized protein YbaR (Trm112 family)
VPGTKSSVGRAPPAPVGSLVRDAALGAMTMETLMKIEDWLLEILACPKCHAPLRVDDAASELVCTGADCGLAYPVRDDIPVLLIDEARDPAAGSVRE